MSQQRSIAHQFSPPNVKSQRKIYEKGVSFNQTNNFVTSVSFLLTKSICNSPKVNYTAFSALNVRVIEKMYLNKLFN